MMSSDPMMERAQVIPTTVLVGISFWMGSKMGVKLASLSGQSPIVKLFHLQQAALAGTSHHLRITLCAVYGGVAN